MININKPLSSSFRGLIFRIVMLFGIVNQVIASESTNIPKCDSLKFSVDSSKVIFFKKKKSGVYDIANNKLLIKPTKNPIFYLHSHDFFVQVTKDGFKVDYFENGNSIYNFSSINFKDLLIIFPASEDELFQNVLKINKLLMNYKTGSLVQNRAEFKTQFHPETFYEIDTLDENRLLINYYRSPVKPVLLTNEIYTVDSGFGMSGVYNLKTRNWEISPVYKRCELKDSILFCALEQSNFGYADADFQFPMVWYSRSYDIYAKRGNNWVLKKAGLAQLNPEDIKEIMPWDSVEVLRDSIHVIAIENGKKYLWQIELNHYIEGTPNATELIFNKIIPGEFDYIHVDLESDLVFTYDKSSGLMVHSEMTDDHGELKILNSFTANERAFYGRNSEKNVVLIDDKEWAYNDFISKKITQLTRLNSIRISAAEIQFSRMSGIALIDDSLIYRVDYKVDSVDQFAYPIRSMAYPDEDSLIISTEGFASIIYPPSIRGYERSGVYNLQSKNWLIPPHFEFITWNSTGFLGLNFIDNGNDGYNEDFVYTLFNDKGEPVFSQFKVKDFFANAEHYLNAFLPSNHMGFRKFSERSSQITLPEESYFLDYYVQNESGLWQVYSFYTNDGFLTISPQSKPKALVHYCPDYDYYIYLENDSLYLDWNAKKYAVAAENGEIIISFQEDAEMLDYRLTLIENQDTSFIFSNSELSEQSYRALANYRILENEFIVNEDYYFSNFDQYYIDTDTYWLWGEGRPNRDYYQFASETAVVWRQQNGIWTMDSPFYSTIKKCQLGYLVETASREKLDFKTGDVKVINESRTLLLDKQLKPLSFFDYYDFNSGTVYEFGISLFTDKGCFLINNKGELVTTDEWDQFEFEDGKIKAILYKPIDPDNYWEWDGEDLIEKVEYFEWIQN